VHSTVMPAKAMVLLWL